MYILGMTQKMMANMTASKPMNLKEWCIVYNRQYLIDEYSPKNAKPMEAYTYGSTAKVLWCKSLVSPITNIKMDGEWEQSIKERTTRNRNSPYEAGKAVLFGFNDLKTWCIFKNCQYLIDEYSPKNAKPMEAYSYGSREKVWWCKNGMPDWQQPIKERTTRNRNSPYEAGKAVVPGVNDLKTWCIEHNRQYLIDEFSPKNAKPMEEYMYGSHAKVWWRKNGKPDWKQEIRDRTIRNCKCPYDAGSMMERFTYDYLSKNNITFKKEYKVTELGNKRFDIFIPDRNKIIELDGIQHFTDSNEFFEAGDTPFDKRIENDNLKNEYCKKHNIELLRVPYICSDNEDEFIKILTDFIVDGKINDKVVDWYKRKEFSNYLK